MTEYRGSDLGKAIQFNDAMVLAILEGRKTETRRVIKPQPPDGTDYVIAGEDEDLSLCIRDVEGGEWSAGGPDPWRRCPYGVPGDRLWVRETHWLMDGRHDPWPDMPSTLVEPIGATPQRCYYRVGFDRSAPRWRPPQYMPWWASRITLRVESIGAELVDQIDKGGALREGVWSRHEFARLWDRINARRGYGWDTSPWVWVVRFSVDEVTA